MESIRRYSCDLIIGVDDRHFEWVLMVSASSYAEAAALAESHVRQWNLTAEVEEMHLQLATASPGEPAVQYVREPREVVRARPPTLAAWWNRLF